MGPDRIFGLAGIFNINLQMWLYTTLDPIQPLIAFACVA